MENDKVERAHAEAIFTPQNGWKSIDGGMFAAEPYVPPLAEKQKLEEEMLRLAREAGLIKG